MPKQSTKYSKGWEQTPEFKDWLAPVSSNQSKAKCLWCNSEFSVANGGKSDVTGHSKSKKHLEIVSTKINTPPARQIFGICLIEM